MPTLKELLEQGKKKESQSVTFRLPAELSRTFEAICEKEKISRNRIIVQLVRSFVEDYQKTKKV